MGRTAVTAAVLLTAIPISLLLNSIVPHPYMDEIFHVPQAQKYCNGDFWYWDPMITTPPGLYGLSLAYIAYLFPFKFITNQQSFSSLCTTPILRSTNIILTIICSILIHDIMMVLKPGMNEKKATRYAILAGLYPLHWFFTFLYYTDVASLTAVLAMYLSCLKKRFWISALFGALAILCRQTNAIWVLFVAGNGAISYIEDLYANNYKVKIEENDNSRTDVEIKPISQNLRRRKKNNDKNTNKLLSSDSSQRQLDYSLGLIHEIIYICQKIWQFKWRVIIAFMPFILVLFAFVAFIFWNGGIVLGAKEAHVVSPHFAQIFYFGLISALAAFPLHFDPRKISELFHLFMQNKIRNIFLIISSLCLSTTAIHYFSIAHPYLLADNRHYTFYIWRRIIQAHWSMKYILIPLYIYSWLSIITSLGKENKRIWILSYILSVALVLVPAPLIEFRYFTIPLILSFVHSPIMSDFNILILGFIYAFVNIITLGLFLFRPFEWEHEHGIQRFMW
ncbi:hypothetical protein LUZ60_004085 [Juncus effusus]|nr:hypothetical protein LUZ60_004085 [Juncus effusus]